MKSSNYNKGLMKQIRYDVKTGIILEWKKLIFVPVIVFICCMSFMSKVKVFSTYSNISIPNVGDYLVEFFKGKEYLKDFSGKGKFDLPIVWIIIHFYFIFIVSSYPYKDFTERGYQYLIRTERKSVWWISKCVWVGTVTIGYYGLIYISIICFAVMNGSDKLIPNSTIGIHVSEIDISRISMPTFFLLVIIMPIMISFSIGVVEMTLSFLFSPLAAMLTIVIYLISSAYWCRPYLLGNYEMLYRNINIIKNGGMNVETGLILCGIFSFCAIFIGLRKFIYMDCIQRKGEIE